MSYYLLCLRFTVQVLQARMPGTFPETDLGIFFSPSLSPLYHALHSLLYSPPDKKLYFLRDNKLI